VRRIPEGDILRNEEQAKDHTVFGIPILEMTDREKTVAIMTLIRMVKSYREREAERRKRFGQELRDTAQRVARQQGF